MLIVFVVRLIAKAIHKAVKMAALGTVNRILGSLFGGLKFLFILAGLIFLTEMIDSRYPFIKKESKEKSLMYMPLSKVIPFIYPRMEREFKLQNEDQSIMAFIPGNTFPSKYSISAPPPVEI
jgi:membrane protein required for colicin V production